MKTFKAKIKITLRENILDVQGKAVEQALHSLSYNDINQVRIGKYVELLIEASSEEIALERVKSSCEQLIANPIIEDYNVALDVING